MNQFIEPLPEWAAARSDGDYTKPMTQLLTRDGRRTGNAVVLRDEVSHGHNVSVVQTDAGNIMKLTLGELEELFHSPLFIMKRPLLVEMADLLRCWKCAHCGGSGNYLNRNKTTGTARIRCKFCGGSGLHPIAQEAISKLEGQP